MKIYGAKRQKQSSHKPYIQKDTASSTNSYQALYGLSEGEIYGLVDGGKSIRLDGTPIINDNGEPNFPDVSWDFRAGSIDQTHIKGFSSVENEQSINVELRHDRPYTKAINNKQLSAVAIRLGFNALREQKDNGDVVGYRIEYAIDVQTDGGAWEMVLNTAVDDKVSQGYQRSHRIDLPKAQQGWSVRVRRLTPNRDSEMVSDSMVVSAVTEIIDAKLRYPCTALLALKYDAQTFSNIAKVSVRVRGMLIQVPSNYNPIARTYDGLWNGEFKLAYSNNPAWVFYDICTAKRYGLGDRLAGKVDKWSLYRLAQYCDEMVDDGKGGKEPRFTVNVYLQKADDAYRVLQNLSSVFRALSFWDGQSIVVDADTPKEPVYVFSNANVIGGEFSYTGTRARDRHTIVKCAYDDPDNNFETDYIYVQDEHAIAKYGINQLELNLFGCTSKGQAQRAGIWALKSEQLETETVSFSTGLDGFIPKVGEIIHVQDNSRAGRMQAGRIVATDGRQITLDRMAGKVGDTVMVGDNSAKIVQIDDTVITLDTAIGSAGQVFAISSSDVAPRAYRVMTISQNDDASFSFTALQYEIGKFTATNNIAAIPKKEVSVIKAHVLTPPNSVTLTERTRTHQGQAITTLVISWEQVVGAVAYLVEYKKDGNAWQTHKVSSQSLEIDGVYAGVYQAKVRAIDAFDNESLSQSSQLTQITGKQGKPPRPINLTALGVLFGMNLGWNFAKGSGDTNYTEIQVSPDGRSNIATLGTFAYPTNKHEITGLQGNLTQFYRGRIVDKLGNTSDWTAWVRGTTSADAGKVLELISGQINGSHLDQTLRTPIAKIGELQTAVDGVNAQLPTLNSQLATANRELQTAISNITTERNRISGAIRDITALQADKNAKTTEIANLTQTVGSHTSSIRELGVTTGDLSQKYAQIKTQADNATSEISAIKQTQSGQATSIDRLGARFDSLSVGGRNLLRESSNTQHFGYGTRFELTQAPNVGDDVVVTIWGEIGSDRNGQIGVYNSHGWTELFVCTKIADGIYQGKGKWGKPIANGQELTPNDTHLEVFFYPRTATSNNRIDKIKLERGNIATDWTPAPEDLQADIDSKASSASLDEFKQASANADNALSQRINTLDAQYKKADTDLTARIAREETARADGDNANTQALRTLESTVQGVSGRVGASESKIATLERTTADTNQALATAQNQLNARFDSLSVGGRNLLKNSNPSVANANYMHRFELTNAPSVGDEVVVTLWGDMGADRTGIGVYNTQGYTELFKLAKIADGVYQGKGRWRLPMNGSTPRTPNDTHLNVYFYPNSATSQNRIDRIKLEKGNVATDWTPAPEDLQADIDSKASSASLDEFKQTQATKDTATAQKLSQLESGLGAKANTIALNELNTRVTQVDGRITAEANKVSQLQTTLNGQTTSIRNVEQSVNGVRSIKAVTVDNNGFISGYGLMSDLQNGRVTSRFGINADQIYFGGTTSAKKPFVFTTRTTVIDGVSYPAGAWINSASIARASINMLHIADSIQSDNYVAGRQGWRLFKDGRFELNNTFGDGSSLELNSQGLTVWYDKAQGKKAVELGILL